MLKQIITIGFGLIISCNNIFSLSLPTIFKNEHTTGEINKHTFSSNILNDSREIYIWIPKDYYETTHEYSVLILHDGQNVFYPGASMSGHEWHLDETVSDLIQAHEIEPIIMIGVSNSKNRSEEYNPLKIGKKYGRCLTQELLPAVRSQYRITRDRKRIGTMGASMGGLISLYLGWELNSHFSKAACLSPALKYKDFNYVKQLTNKPVDGELKLFIINGTEDLDKMLQEGVNDFIEYLDLVQFPERELLYIVGEGDSHSESAWASQSINALRWLYPK